MSFLKGLFVPLYRRARRAEARGEFREAAALYLEGDWYEEAANAFLFCAARSTELGERIAALRDALVYLEPKQPRYVEVEGQLGLLLLEEAQRRGTHTADERARLVEAAERLERAGRAAEAATAFELLGRMEDVARCLEKAGDIERLEALLEQTSDQAQHERELRRHVSDYESSLSLGARVEARASLQKARDLSPSDAALADLQRRLEARMLPGHRLTLRVQDREVAFVGQPKLVLGRDADVAVRGSSVSRKHTEVELREGRVVVRDLGSRNGTLVRGLPLAGEMELEGESEIGLGDDVQVRVARDGDQLRLEVLGGLDRGLVVVAGRGALAIPGARATVSFPGSYPTLTAEPGVAMRLGSQRIVAPVSLLRDDVLELDGVRVEVV